MTFYSFYYSHSTISGGIDNRAEIKCLDDLGYSSGRVNWHAEYWMGFVFKPINWDSSLSDGTDPYPTGASRWQSVIQFHAVPREIGSTGLADWNILASANFLHIYGISPGWFQSDINDKIIYCASKPIDGTDGTSLPYSSTPPGSHAANIPDWYVACSDVDNTWMRFVLNFIISPDADGKVKLWYNGSPVVDYSGPNLYYNDTGGQPAMQYAILQTGGYKTPSSTNFISARYDRFTIYGSDGSYALVDPDRA